jgi:hypothetical protein
VGSSSPWIIGKMFNPLPNQGYIPNPVIKSGVFAHWVDPTLTLPLPRGGDWKSAYS